MNMKLRKSYLDSTMCVVININSMESILGHPGTIVTKKWSQNLSTGIALRCQSLLTCTSDFRLMNSEERLASPGYPGTYFVWQSASNGKLTSLDQATRFLLLCSIPWHRKTWALRTDLGSWCFVVWLIWPSMSACTLDKKWQLRRLAATESSRNEIYPQLKLQYLDTWHGGTGGRSVTDWSLTTIWHNSTIEPLCIARWDIPLYTATISVVWLNLLIDYLHLFWASRLQWW